MAGEQTTAAWGKFYVPVGPSAILAPDGLFSWLLTIDLHDGASSDVTYCSIRLPRSLAVRYAKAVVRRLNRLNSIEVKV